MQAHSIFLVEWLLVYHHDPLLKDTCSALSELDIHGLFSEHSGSHHLGPCGQVLTVGIQNQLLLCCHQCLSHP